MDSRIVEVNREFMAQLLQYLQPEERWTENRNSYSHSALILYTYVDGTRKLLFVVKDEQ